MSNGYSATGRIIDDIFGLLEASSGLDEDGQLSIHPSGEGCVSEENAKRNVVKRLANQLRSKRDKQNFIYWDMLASKEKNQLISEITTRLIWVGVGQKRTKLTEISANEFMQAMNRAVA